MMHLLLAVALGTLLAACPVVQAFVRGRRVWQREQARRQDRLMREDVERWTDRVAWALATTGESWELDSVRPLPKPTFLHRGALGVPWLFMLWMWLGFMVLCWMLLAVAIFGLPQPSQVPSAVPLRSTAEWQAFCAET